MPVKTKLELLNDLRGKQNSELSKYFGEDMQVLRDLLISTFDIRATMSIDHDDSKSQAFLQDKWSKVDQWVRGKSNLITLDVSNGQFKILHSGTYIINVNMSFSVSVNALTMEMHLFRNSLQMHSGSHSYFVLAAQQMHIGCSCIPSLQVGDIISLHIMPDKNTTVTYFDAQVTIHKIG